MTEEPRDESSPTPEITTAAEPSNSDTPEIPTPPLLESLVALGLMVIVAWSFWVWYGPLIKGMWQAMMKHG